MERPKARGDGGIEEHDVGVVRQGVCGVGELILSSEGLTNDKREGKERNPKMPRADKKNKSDVVKIPRVIVTFLSRCV